MIEIKYTRDGVPEDVRYFKTVNEYVRLGKKRSRNCL